MTPAEDDHVRVLARNQHAANGMYSNSKDFCQISCSGKAPMKHSL
jgi:hypothetical protein